MNDEIVRLTIEIVLRRISFTLDARIFRRLTSIDSEVSVPKTLNTNMSNFSEFLTIILNVTPTFGFRFAMTCNYLPQKIERMRTNQHTIK